MLPQAKEHLEPPEAGRGKEEFSLYDFGTEHGPADTLILRINLLYLQNFVSAVPGHSHT